MFRISVAAKLLVFVALLMACSFAAPVTNSTTPPTGSTTPPTGSTTPPSSATSSSVPAPLPTGVSSDLETARSKIKHVVVIMQENRSFDEYFGTYPGADGIPMQNGVPSVCVPDRKTSQCVKPYHNPADVNAGGAACRYSRSGRY